MTDQITHRPVMAITGGRRDERGQTLIPSPVQMDRFVRLLGWIGPIEVRHGAAVGTDRYVGRFLEQWERAGGWHIGAVFYRFSYRVNAFPVDQSLDGEWPGAGHRRNLRMLTTAPGVDVLVAFPGAAGTENCIEQAIDDGRGQVTVYKWRGDRMVGEFVKIYGTREGQGDL